MSQTYFLSKAFGYLIRIGLFSIDSAFLDKEIFLTFFLGLNIIDWLSILVSIVLQFVLFSVGMNFNKKIIKPIEIAINKTLKKFSFL